MKRSLMSRYLPAFILILIGAFTVFSIFLSTGMNDTLTGMYKRHLIRTAELIEVLLTADDTDPAFQKINEGLANSDTATRLTIIKPDGVVVADSHYDTSLLDNHGNRPEVRKALGGEAAFAVRGSDTLKLDMLYYAQPVRRNGEVAFVIRTSVPMEEISALQRNVLVSDMVAALVILCVAVGFAFLINRKTSVPLQRIREAVNHYAEGELEYSFFIDGPPGIRELADNIRYMAHELIHRINLVTRQRNELEAIFAGMIEAVVVLDEDLNIKTINGAACRLSGFSREDAVGLRFIEVFRNSELEGFIRNLLKDGSPAAMELHYTLPAARAGAGSGYRIPRDRTLQVQGSTFKTGMLGTPEHKPKTRILIVLHDISELKRLEQIRKDFVANVSHELRTPITSIKGYVETLLDGAMNERETARDFLGIIASQTEYINAIVSDLLSLSKLEQAGKSLEVEDLPLIVVAEEAAGICRSTADAKDICLEVFCPEDLRAPVNSILIEQAIVNLIDNAVKYSEKGSTVKVSVERQYGSVFIHVKDSGCGIPEKDLPRLFERFYRVDKARSRDMGGTGLGLAIVKHIAYAHNGDVRVESTEGSGSVFTIRIPAGE